MSAAHIANAWRGRSHAAYVAFLVHRLSGLGLALFLPLHFLALGQAIQSEAALDGFLGWADRPLVKLAEVGLVVLLAVHLAGGLRLLALELLGWTEGQRAAVALAFAFGLATGLLFLLNLFGR